MEIYGTEGTMIATSPGLPQITPVTLLGARGSEALKELAIPEASTDHFSVGPPGNVGRAYQQLGEAIRNGQSFSPDFDHAYSVHRLLDLIEQSSADGRALPAG